MEWCWVEGVQGRRSYFLELEGWGAEAVTMNGGPHCELPSFVPGTITKKLKRGEKSRVRGEPKESNKIG